VDGIIKLIFFNASLAIQAGELGEPHYEEKDLWIN